MVEIVIALSEELMAEFNRRAPAGAARDELVAAALTAYLSRPGTGDLAIINAHAEPLNTEAEDALSYQTPS